MLLGTTTEPPSGPPVVVTTAEHDSHVLGARVVASVLALDGFRVRFLGGSLPAPDLADFLDAHEPSTLVLSCSMATAVASAARSIAATHTYDVPVVAGRAHARGGPGRADRRRHAHGRATRRRRRVAPVARGATAQPAVSARSASRARVVPAPRPALIAGGARPRRAPRSRARACGRARSAPAGGGELPPGRGRRPPRRTSTGSERRGPRTDSHATSSTPCWTRSRAR